MMARTIPRHIMLLCLAVFFSGCGRVSQPVVVVPPTRISTPVSMAQPESTAALAPGYPNPEPQGIPGAPGYPVQEAPGFDVQEAYPAVEMTATAAVWARTLTARPTFTQTVPSPTQMFTPTRGPLAEPLPAPVYYVPSGDWDEPPGQIWRVEQDGFTRSPVTHEEYDVDYRYDIAPDGRLAYVSNNSLIVSDAIGGSRKVIIVGIKPPLPGKQDEWYLEKERVCCPAWSPDGKQIAYWHDGVNLVDPSSGETIKVIPGPKWITDHAGTLVPEEDRYAYHYYPIDWTPDGSRIVLQGVSYESFTMAFIKPEMNATVVQVEIFAAGCCDYSFTQDGQMLFSSGDHTEIGLWLADPKNGRAKNLTGGKQYSFQLGPAISFPIESPGGRIYFLTTRDGLVEGNRRLEQNGKFLAYIDQKKEFLVPEDVTFVSQEPVWMGELWLPDASRLIAAGDDDLIIIDVASGKVTPLGLEGYNLKWGSNR